MKKIFAISLVILLALTAVIPSAVYAAEQTVTITQTEGIATIRDSIQQAIDTAKSGDTINVTGSRTGVDATIKLTIPAGIKVAWKAVYTGRKTLLELYGTGTFEATGNCELLTDSEGYVIKVNDSPADRVSIIVSGNALLSGETSWNIINAYRGNVTVTGGTVRSNSGNLGTAIYTYEWGGAKPGDSGNVVISGGTVEATGVRGIAVNTMCGHVTVTGGTVKVTDAESLHAIDVNSGDITITGGTITSDSSTQPAVKAYAGNITVTGGAVKTTGTGKDVIAVRNSYGDITVTGGAVEAAGKDSYALRTDSGNITITGGAVKATGTGSTALHTGSGVAAYLQGTCTGKMYVNPLCLLVEVDLLLIPRFRNNTDGGLTVKQGTGTVKWDCTGTKPVIKFFPSMSLTPSIIWGEYDPNSKIRKGDINFDGEIDVEDLLMLKKHVLKLAELENEALEAADINDDKTADVEDLLILKKHVLKLIDIDVIYG